MKRLADNVNLGSINAGRMKPYYEKQQEKPIEVENTIDESKKTEQALRTSENTQERPMLTTVRKSSRIHRGPARYNE